MKPATQAAHLRLVNDALNYIYRYIDSDININELCNDLGVSRFHFQRVFKEQMGVNLYECIKSIRLQKAASLLLTNRSATVSTVALACGYGSQSSFIRAFNTGVRR
ncbi:MAG: AraC family transcriptional regulator [Sulfurovum sp.]|nr:AraC family transcriptional regulator [Sulfurovum sp.]